MSKERQFLKETDAWSTVLFADPIGILLARLLSHTPVHPNVVTFFSLVPALASAYFFWRGDSISLLWAALLFWFSWILDCADGKLARLTGKFSKLGGKLDNITDHLRKSLALLALIWGTYRQFGLTWGIITGGGVFFHYLTNFIAHYTPPRVEQHLIPQVPVEKRIIRRVGQYYTAFDTQFLILFIGPVFLWLIPNFPTYMLFFASLLYAVVAVVVKLKRNKENP